MAETEQGQTGAPPAPAGTEVSKDAKTFGMLSHLLGLFTSFIGPLVIWLIKKDSDKFVDDQGKEALNFQITVLIGYAIAFVASFIIIGVVLFPIIWICNLIFCIMGTVKANSGQLYRYPVNIRIIK